MKTMNENNEGPQEWIDPALEARVVAWVLGESSAFEAAELERILAGNPELTIFKRRIEAVHALSGAAIRPEMPRIQLSPERRQKLLATIGIPPARPVKKVLAFPSITWMSSHVLQRLAACLVIGGIIALLSSLSMPAISGSLHKASRRSLTASEKDLGATVSAAGGSDLFFSSRSEMGQVVVQDGQTISNGTFQPNAPVAEAKPMAVAMNVAQTDTDRNLRQNLPPPSAPMPPMSVPTAAMLSNGGVVATTAPPASRAFTAAQPVLMAQAAAQLSEPQESLERADSGRMRNREQSAATGVRAGDVEMLQKAEALAEPASESVQSMAATDELQALPQEAKADVAAKVLVDMEKQIPQQEASAQLMSALQPEERAMNKLQEEAQPLVLEEAMKSESVAMAPAKRLPAGAEEIRDGSGKFDGFVQYGAPITPAPDMAMAAKAVDQPVFRNGSGTAAGAELAADVAAVKNEPARQVAVIHGFTGGWGKGSGGGAGGGVAKEKLSASKEDEKTAALFADDVSGPSGAAVLMEASKDAYDTDGEDKKRALNQAKGVDLMSELEVSTKSGQRAPVQVARQLQEQERESGGQLNSKTMTGAAAYSGSTAIAGGKLGVDRGGAVDLAKSMEDPKSDSVPMLGDVPIAGRLFRSESGKGSSLNFQTEIKTAKQPFSTFSLHVSDVSFQLAKDALSKGAMPDPDRIRAEEFYNAFDYNDPSPAPGEEVACRIEQCANPFVQQRDLVRIALKVAAAGRAAGQPLRLTILLDTSGSMEREDRAASVRRALKTLAALLGPNDRVTLIGFARTPRLLAEQVPGDQAGKLVEIAARTPSEGGTNLEQALALASEQAFKQRLPAAQNRIVLLTDGAANLGNADPARLARQIEKTRQQGISFDACGVGANGLNDEMLEALTRKGDGRYYFLNRPEDADAGFARQLAGALRPAAENVKVQVVFNPARVGQYRLIGFEKHLLKKEDFRNDKVQAAELSAEEAGVAVYQVETLPEGEGELGEVFVRFRDPATGQMVERSWTIPYDAKASTFDQASPSMQLAATAALLAERLRGDSQVDLDALAPVITNLRSKYPHQAKVADLIRMYERMRR